jgi:PBSX family phage terminase large subunit
MKRFGRKAHTFIKRHPSQDKKYTLLEGSVRSSKTFAVDAKLITQLCSYEVEGKRVICGASKQTVYKNILLDVFAIVGKQNYTYNQTSGELWLFGTQWFVVGANDESSFRNILGMTIGIAICDEWTLFPRSFTMQLFLRMSPDGARLYATTNPDNPFHYLFQEVISNKEMAQDLEVIHFTLDDNPNISNAQRRTIERSQTGVYYQRYILGLWVAAEGSIYGSAYSEEEGGNLFTDATMPVGLKGAGGFVERWIAADCGTDHPQVYLEYYDDGKTIWVTKEYRWDSRIELKQKTDGQYADDLEDFIGPNKNACVYVPPECASFKAELAQRGIWYADAENAVDDGIRVTSSLLFQRKVMIHESCKGLRQELVTYIWDEKASKRGEEKPIKVHDDSVDCLRYGLFTKVPAWRVTAAA